MSKRIAVGDRVQTPYGLGEYRGLGIGGWVVRLDSGGEYAFKSEEVSRAEASAPVPAPDPTPDLRAIADLVNENDRLRARVQGLLEANNRLVEEKREAQRTIKEQAEQIGMLESVIEAQAALAPAPEPTHVFGPWFTVEPGTNPVPIGEEYEYGGLIIANTAACWGQYATIRRAYRKGAWHEWDGSAVPPIDRGTRFRVAWRDQTESRDLTLGSLKWANWGSVVRWMPL